MCLLVYATKKIKRTVSQFSSMKDWENNDFSVTQVIYISICGNL